MPDFHLLEHRQEDAHPVAVEQRVPVLRADVVVGRRRAESGVVAALDRTTRADVDREFACAMTTQTAADLRVSLDRGRPGTAARPDGRGLTPVWPGPSGHLPVPQMTRSRAQGQLQIATERLRRASLVRTGRTTTPLTAEYRYATLPEPDRLPRGGRMARCASWNVGIAAVLLAAVVIPLNGLASPAFATSAISQERGFDTCAAPSLSTMKTWWAYSPYYNIGIYIGGSNRACSQANLNSSWITNVQNGDYGSWGILPIWVGPQMPPSCNTRTYRTYISTDTATAYTQGRNEASAAYSAMVNLGMDIRGTPIAYDLEGYSGGRPAGTRPSRS